MEFAKSMSGHDRNRYYLIAGQEGEFVYLVNGSSRTLEKPKKKNRKHIQAVKKLPHEVERILENEITDLTVKKALKEYVKIIGETGPMQQNHKTGGMIDVKGRCN